MTATSTERAFDDIIGLLEQRCGFQANCYERSYLKRRVKARIRRTDPENYSEYFALLEEDQHERAQLVDALSINVTKFFRNPEMWAGLRPYFIDLMERRGSVSCWSAACADGREPYSLAMLACDLPSIDETTVNIVATDIDQGALEAARAGRYQQMRTVDIAGQLEELSATEPYLDLEENTYVIKDHVKSLVEFKRHDLVRDEPPGRFDLVMCRNLLIYIEAAAKQDILDTLVNSLRPGGYLVIGMSETIPRGLFDSLEPADRSNRIYRRC